MKKKLTYKESIQEKVNQVEFDYNAADWNALSKQLPSKGLSTLSKALIGVSSIIITSVTIYYGVNATDKQTITTNLTQVENKEIIQKDELKVNAEQSSKELIIKPNEQVTNKIESIAGKSRPEKVSNQSILAIKSINPTDTKDLQSTISNPTNHFITTIKVENQTICLGELISFSLNQPLRENQFILFNGEAIPKGKNSIKSEKSGISKLQLVEDEKIISSEEVTILELPNIDFEALKINEEFAKINYVFKAKSFANVYTWFIDGVEVGNHQEITHTFKRKGTANIRLLATSSEGCRNSYSKDLAIEESFDLLSYDAFTPDGDGINDEFIPKALEANNLKFTMTIYTPSGVELYTTNDYYQPWNGRRNNDGEKMAPGVYLWKVFVYDDEQQPHPFSGQIRIVQLR